MGFVTSRDKFESRPPEKNLQSAGGREFILMAKLRLRLYFLPAKGKLGGREGVQLEPQNGLKNHSYTFCIQNSHQGGVTLFKGLRHCEIVVAIAF